MAVDDQITPVLTTALPPRMRWLSLRSPASWSPPARSSRVGGALRMLRLRKPRLELAVAPALLFTKLVYMVLVQTEKALWQWSAFLIFDY